MRAHAAPTNRKRVVIIGGGFAGIAAARALKRCDAEVVLIDRRNHHIFQPLLYQVATAVLAPAEIAAPIRQIEQKQKNLMVMLAGARSRFELAVGQLVLSGSRNPYNRLRFLDRRRRNATKLFRTRRVCQVCAGTEELERCGEMRTKILGAYELAELTDDEHERARLMTFVLVGAGPTGVELAASMAQMASGTLRGNFRRIDPAKTSIVLIEGGTRALPSFSNSLSDKADEKIGETRGQGYDGNDGGAC